MAAAACQHQWRKWHHQRGMAAAKWHMAAISGGDEMWLGIAVSVAPGIEMALAYGLKAEISAGYQSAYV
jgi:hypothetical protein